MEFKLMIQEPSLPPKKRRNIAVESGNRHLKLAMAKLAVHLQEERQTLELISKNAPTHLEAVLARRALERVEAIELWCEHNFKHFQILGKENRGAIMQTIETQGKR
jgi:hypothetical protein